MEVVQANSNVSLKRAEGKRLNAQIIVDVNEERGKSLKAGVFRLMMKDPENQFKFIAHFMTRPDGEYMEYKEACEILDDLDITEVGSVFNAIQEAVQNIAAPKK